MPTLPLTFSVWFFPYSKLRRSMSRRASHRETSVSRLSTSRISTTNSSPPTRPMMSPSEEKTSASDSAMSEITASPKR